MACSFKLSEKYFDRKNKLKVLLSPHREGDAHWIFATGYGAPRTVGERSTVHPTDLYTWVGSEAWSKKLKPLKENIIEFFINIFKILHILYRFIVVLIKLFFQKTS